MGLQADKKDRRLYFVSPKYAFQLPVIGQGLADRLRPLIDHIERVIHRHMLAEARPGQQPTVFQHGAQVVAHAHSAYQLLGAGGDADLEIVHAGSHHQLGQFGIEIVCPDIGRPADILPALRQDCPQQLLGILYVAACRDELGIGEPKAAHAAVIELSHLGDHLLHRVHPHRLALHHGVDAVAAVMGTAALGLHAHVEVARLQVPVELGPDGGDVVVIAGGFLHTPRLLVNQAGPGGLPGQEAALGRQRLAADQLLQQRLPLPHRHHRAAGQLAAQLFVKDAHRTAAQHRQSIGAKAAGGGQAPAQQAQVAPQLAIEGRHQPQSTHGSPQPPQRIAGVKNLEGMLQGIAAPAIHGGIDLDVAPGKHQQRRPKAADRGQQHPLHIQQRHGGQV